MSQIYHNNALTNANIRNEIQSSVELDSDLSLKYGITIKTVIKWKKRGFVNDKSSRPDNINYKLSEIEKSIIISLRKSNWIKLDEITDILTVKFHHVIPNSRNHVLFYHKPYSEIPLD